jgi:type II secretory pathway pseudopilin PulG
MKGHVTSAFSLVEVTLALGIAAFCLIAVFGLMPVGLQTNRNAKSQTRATNLMAAVMSDLRATPSIKTTSLQFCIPLTTSTTTTLYFDSEGRCSSNLAGSTSPCGVAWVPPLETRYRVNITLPLTGKLTYADLKVTWPAPVDPATTTPSGSVEMFAAFDRY